MLKEIYGSLILAQVKIDNRLPQTSTDAARLTIILNTTFVIVGAIAVMIITIAGFRYVLSHGDPNLIAQSKNAIIYAVIGLIVTISAAAIVNFMLKGF